jgi:hypothetical protein
LHEILQQENGILGLAGVEPGARLATGIFRTGI